MSTLSAVHVIHNVFSNVNIYWRVTMWTLRTLCTDYVSSIYLCRCRWWPSASSCSGWLRDSVELRTFPLLWHWSSIRSNKNNYGVIWFMSPCFRSCELCFLTCDLQLSTTVCLRSESTAEWTSSSNALNKHFIRFEPFLLQLSSITGQGQDLYSFLFIWTPC